nr:hypothetical protein GCM10020092_065070 [Actinoplanes digitatis]
MTVSAETIAEVRNTENVIAESRYGNPDEVVMVGAHLDSVPGGAGINDNGSGSASILEVALQMRNFKTKNKVRFAWWGAEEANLVGSTFYVNGLSAEEHAKIALYLNFDMIGSPNYQFGVYDGDNSAGEGAGPGPAGSAQIEAVFEAYFASQHQATAASDFTGRSDYGPFIATGIPAERPVHRRGGRQDRGGRRALGRHRGPAVRPVLPRPLRQPDPRAQRRRRRGLRPAPACVPPVRQRQHVRHRQERRRRRHRGSHVRARHLVDPAARPGGGGAGGGGGRPGARADRSG